MRSLSGWLGFKMRAIFDDLDNGMVRSVLSGLLLVVSLSVESVWHLVTSGVWFLLARGHVIGLFVHFLLKVCLSEEASSFISLL